MQGVLGVSALDYVFYAFFNLINPVLVIYAFGIKILRLSPPEHIEIGDPRQTKSESIS